MDLRGLSLICAGLGVAEEDIDGNRIGYTKDEYCSDNLKDLLRFLRRDDPQTREVFKQVCKWNIVSKDLIPIIEYCQDDHNLVLNAVKVLVFLTMPIDSSSSDIPQRIEYLWGLKSSITYSNTVAVIVSRLEGPLQNLEHEAFTEDDWKLVELILTLIRNILAIQDIFFQQKAGGSASQFLSLRDKFLELLFHENVMDIILVITQHSGGSCGYLRQNNLLLLEIFHCIIMGQEPELIAKAHKKSSKVDEDTGASLDCLKSIIEKEKERRKLSLLRNVARHSQFSGTFTRLTMNGSKTVIKGNPIPASCGTLHKPRKVHRGPVKKIVWDHGRLPSTKDNILELLHDFLNQFLSGGYNDLMQSICEDIEKEHPAIQKSDIVVFFQVAQFVTSFQYHKYMMLKPNMDKDKFGDCGDEYADDTHFKGDICGPIAATMNESMFLLVISRWRNAFEGLKETNDYKFLSAAGSLMKVLIQMLELVLTESPENSREPQTARVLLYKLFYDQTDEGMTQFLLNLIKSFDTHKQPKSDLADLVEMINVIVLLMENLQARATLRVSKKLRKQRKSKSMSDKKQTENELSGNHATVQNKTVIHNGEESVDMDFSCEAGPVDASSDGKGGISVTFQVDGPELSVLETGNCEGSLLQMDRKKSDNMNDDTFDGTSDSSGDEQPAATDEVDFKMSTLVSAFANNSIIRNLCWLLKFYKSNSPSTNQYIIRFLQRITDDLGLSPMLYQLSLLTTFYEILAEQKSCPCEEYANIVSFLTSLVRKMLKKMKTQPLLFVEVLFWKSRRECHYINAEYLSHEVGKLKKQSRAWGNAEDGELGLSHAKGWTHRSIADALGEDEADVVISHELGRQNNEVNSDEMEEDITSISNREINSGGNSMEHESEKVSTRKRRFVLDDELEIKIKDLYEKFKDDRNCSRLIAEALDPDGNLSAAQVANKLKQLGLKAVPKKRMRYADVAFPAGPNQAGEEGNAMERKIASNNGLERSSQMQPLHTRKRVHAFSEDQEAMIKALFEKFKDHKRCSYLIANALEADSTFTAAQISRKLTQLGLRVPRQKRTEADFHLIDEDVNDLSKDNMPDSDDETLLSLKNRSKNKQSRLDGVELPKPNIEGNLSEDDSDDKILSSILSSKNKRSSTLDGVQLPKPNIEGDLSEDDSDDKILSSIPKKTRKLRKSKEGKHQSQSTTSNKISGSKLIQDVIERKENSAHMKATGPDEDVTFNHLSRDGISEAEVTDSVNENLLGVSPVNSVDDLQQQQVEEELADLWDDEASGALSNNTVTRRKLRMVDDDDDDDDD